MSDNVMTCAMLLRLLAAPIQALSLVTQVVNQKDDALLITLKNGQRFAVMVSGPAEVRSPLPIPKADRKQSEPKATEA